MAYTLDKLVATLRRRLKDLEFSEDSLKEYLNDSQNEILGESKYPFMEALDVYEAEPKGEVSLPFDYDATIELLAKTDKFTRKMEYLPAQDYLASDRASRFYIWTLIGKTLFYNLPREKGKDCFCDTYILKHLYLRRAKTMDKASDRPEIPEEFIEALILGALSRAEQERDNFDYAQIYRNQQEDLTTNMKLRYGPKNQNMDNRSRLAWRQWGGNC